MPLTSRITPIARSNPGSREAPGVTGPEERARNRRGRSHCEQLPVDPARQMPDEPRRPDRDTDEEVRPDGARRLLADPADERGDAERPEDQPDQAADRADETRGDHRGGEVDRPLRDRGGAAPRPQEVGSEDEEARADHEPEHARRQTPGRIPAGEGAGDGRRQHPGDETPVDSAGADMDQ